MAKKSASRGATQNSAAATLKALGLEAVNPGVFDGTWSGSGKILQSFSPNDGSLLGSVRTADRKSVV